MGNPPQRTALCKLHSEEFIANLVNRQHRLPIGVQLKADIWSDLFLRREEKIRTSLSEFSPIGAYMGKDGWIAPKLTARLLSPSFASCQLSTAKVQPRLSPSRPPL